MAVEVEIDVQVLKSEIKKTYASVSQEPEKDFIFPSGRPWAEDLGYPAELANVPETAVGSFAGVANPWQLGARPVFISAQAGESPQNDREAVGEMCPNPAPAMNLGPRCCAACGRATR